VWITGVGQQSNAGQTDCEQNAIESRQREKEWDSGTGKHCGGESDRSRK
jgi:hypothetical protein